ncbi:hypothetical protein BW716_01795 [[Flexibacter] sp. ATCC 35208]|nr:hypothetical protein BW716_01795 [[Flexibacter] sp. ATCC 35208]
MIQGFSKNIILSRVNTILGHYYGVKIRENVYKLFIKRFIIALFLIAVETIKVLPLPCFYYGNS